MSLNPLYENKKLESLHKDSSFLIFLDFTVPAKEKTMFSE